LDQPTADRKDKKVHHFCFFTYIPRCFPIGALGFECMNSLGSC